MSHLSIQLGVGFQGHGIAAIGQMLVDDAEEGLPSAIASELIRLYESDARCRTNAAPDTTWELPVPRLQPAPPNSAFQGEQR